MPLPSPTTTSAVKLNRRPPWTTLATRLMVTTRSRYAVPYSAPGPRRSSRRSRRSPPPPWAPRRGAAGIRSSSSVDTSQVQSALARAVCQRGNPAVVGVATAVEHSRADTGLHGPLGEQRPDLLSLGCLVAIRAADLQRRGRRQRVLGGVVDELGEGVLRRAGDDQPRTRRAAFDLLAHAQVAALQRRDARGGPARDAAVPSGPGARHCYLPAFPTLRRICSPWYFTPLPLYGSGLRSLRMLAATSPTCCLSMPSTTNLVGVSTLKVMPSGAATGTGWL